MWQTFRKTGWKLNDNDKIVNAVLKRIEKCNGECPCQNPRETHEDRACPYKEYRIYDVCHCNLYVKDEVHNSRSYI